MKEFAHGSDDTGDNVLWLSFEEVAWRRLVQLCGGLLYALSRGEVQLAGLLRVGWSLVNVGGGHWGLILVLRGTGCSPEHRGQQCEGYYLQN